MAILLMNREVFVEMEDVVAVLTHLKSVQFDPDVLCKKAFDELKLDRDRMNDLRNFHKFKHIQEMHKRNKDITFKDLKRHTKCISSILCGSYLLKYINL